MISLIRLAIIIFSYTLCLNWFDDHWNTKKFQLIFIHAIVLYTIFDKMGKRFSDDYDYSRDNPSKWQVIIVHFRRLKPKTAR